MTKISEDINVIHALNDAVENNRLLYKKGDSVISVSKCCISRAFQYLRGYRRENVSDIISRIEKGINMPSIACLVVDSSSHILDRTRINFRKFLVFVEDKLKKDKGDYGDETHYDRCAATVNRTCKKLLHKAMKLREEDINAHKHNALFGLFIPLPSDEPVLNLSPGNEDFIHTLSSFEQSNIPDSPSLTTSSFGDQQEFQTVHHSSEEIFGPEMDPVSSSILDGKWLNIEEEYFPKFEVPQSSLTPVQKIRLRNEYAKLIADANLSKPKSK